MKSTVPLVMAVALCSSFTPVNLTFAQGTAFTYQGRLVENGAAANGLYDLSFSAWVAASGPSQAGGTLSTNGVPVSNGLFTVTLDFGPGIFTGPDRWLEIGVRTNGTGVFATLAPRQKLTATPYAITASNLTGVVPNAGVGGTYSSAVTFSNPANSFTGNGGGLTNVNALTLGGIGNNGFWRTAGNAGTTPGPNFLGTTDNQPLELRVNATRALRLEAIANDPNHSNIVNVAGGSSANFVAPGVSGGTIAGGGAKSFLGAAGSNSVAASFGTVGGGLANISSGVGATVGGGGVNISSGLYATVSGGTANAATADYSLVGGGIQNTNLAFAATLAGGDLNFIQPNSLDATISGGEQNIIGTNAGAATISGGLLNTIFGGAGASTVGGGSANVIQSNSVYSTIGGGFGNVSDGTSSTVGGGYNNYGTGPGSTVGGGSHNQSAGQYATVSGGLNNSANVDYGFIGGGNANFLGDNNGTISGGVANIVSGNTGAIIGGYNNIIQSGADLSTIGGGSNNVIQASSMAAFIGGGQRNFIQNNTMDATIAGGEQNRIGTNAGGATIGGGLVNQILDGAGSAAIAGGNLNVIGSGSIYAAIGGGDMNSIGANIGRATIGGGHGNTCSGSYATVGGGYFNTSSGPDATVGGGNLNSSSGQHATVPGGFNNSAAGDSSFAAGNRARANHQGSFVWADSQNADFASTANDQFSLRAAGGVRLNIDTSIFCGSQTRQMLNLWSTEYGIGVQAATEYLRSSSDFCWFKGGVHNDGQHNPGTGGTEMMRLDSAGNLKTLTGTISSLSDRDAKERFEPVDSRDVLDKVAALPLSKWSYKSDRANRHIGPVAQDFYATFAVGLDDKGICTVDADGVALAAIQGLNQKLEEQLARKDGEIRELKAAVADLTQMISRLNLPTPPPSR